LRRADLIDGSLELLTRRSEVLEKFDLVIEMDDEGFVLVLAEDVIEKGATGGELLIKDAALAEAGVDQQAKGEREIGFLGEISDGLWFGILFEGEITFGEIVDEGVVLVADGDEEIDGVDVDGDGGSLLGERRREIQEVEEGKDVKEHFHDDNEKNAKGAKSVVRRWQGPEKGPGPALLIGVPARGEFGCMVNIPGRGGESSRGFGMLRRAGIRK